MQRHQQTVIFIAIIVLITIGTQLYWNYTQYANNRLQVIHNIQQMLDEVSKEYRNSQASITTYTTNDLPESIGKSRKDSIEQIVNEVLQGLNRNETNPEKPSVSYTIMEDHVDLQAFNALLKPALDRLNYQIVYNLKARNNGIVTDSLNNLSASFNTLSAQTTLSPLENTATLELIYQDPVMPALLQGLTGIVLSLILCLTIIFTLYYLQQIIKKQKEISEIKNDFISNVTHEFKTPIATIASAIEAIKKFNNENISDKTLRYLDISEEQLKKLNILVEKVMETSLLESSQLSLDLQQIDIVTVVKELVNRHQLNTSKTIHLDSHMDTIAYNADAFHFENAISNLIDNAIKYGGNEINIRIWQEAAKQITLSISDNGTGISTEDAPFIFDKFYRARSKNLNHIKGFGIGLYYTKNIIQKHKGTIELCSPNTFKISLWTE